MSSFSYSYSRIRIRALNLCVPLSLKSSAAVTSFHYQCGVGLVGTPALLPSPPFSLIVLNIKTFLLRSLSQMCSRSKVWAPLEQPRMQKLSIFVFWPLLNCRPVAIVTTILEMGSVSSRTHLFIYIFMIFWGGMTSCCDCAAYNLRAACFDGICFRFWVYSEK